MFEHSLLLENGTTNKSWTLLASVSGQVLLVSVAVMVPLVYTDALPHVDIIRPVIWCTNIKPVPPAPGSSRPVLQTNPHPLLVFNRPLTPTRIPDQTQVINDAAPVLPSGSGFGIAVGDGPPGPAVASSRLEPPPPPPPMKQPVKETLRPLRISVNHPAKVIYQVLPVYPRLAIPAHISGVVKLEGIIATDGTIQQLRVISGHPMLVQAALDAVRQWRYEPTMLNQQPVEVVAPIFVNFILQR